MPEIAVTRRKLHHATGHDSPRLPRTTGVLRRARGAQMVAIA
jgi:hypothetical protein